MKRRPPHDSAIAPQLDEAVLRALRHEPAERPTMACFEEMLVKAVQAQV